MYFFSVIKKQKSLPQNLKPSKPKSASHHMKLAEKNLNHFQKSQLSNSIPSSVKSKPKENITVTPKPSKVQKYSKKNDHEHVCFCFLVNYFHYSKSSINNKTCTFK